MSASTAYTAMLKRMGFTPDAADYISAADKGGFDTLQSLEVLAGGDPTGSGFIKSMRRPGGDSANGETVSYMAELNFKHLLFFLRHKKRTNRSVSASNITVTAINALNRQQEFEASSKEDSKEPALPHLDPEDWSLTAENVMHWLSQYRGVEGAPLSYVIREELRVPGEAVDPTYGDADSVYASHDEELVARSSILKKLTGAALTKSDEQLEKAGPFTDTFLMDSAKVYDLLTHLFGTETYFTYIKDAGKKRGMPNGRMGWFALFNHFVGPNMVDHITTDCEATLRNTTYMGEGRKFNFEQYVTLQKSMHHRLKNLERYGGRKLSEGEKLRYFRDGLKHNGLENIKIFIMNDSACRASYDKSVDAVKEFIKTEMKPHAPSLKVAAFESGSRTLTPDEIAECTFFFKREDWDAKTQDDRDRILANRQLHKKQTGIGPSASKTDTAQVKKLKKQQKHAKKEIASLKRKISSLQRSKKVEDDSSGDEDECSADEVLSNANHPALTRGKSIAKVKKEGKRSKKD